jgi:ribosome-associated protein
MSITLEVRGEYIQLDQLLKTTGLCHSGGYAHAEIEAGKVRVDGQIDTRKRAKIRPGQVVSYGGETIALIAGPLA